MPRYRFKWEALPPSMLRRVKADLKLGPGDPAAVIRRAYGARPTDEFIRDAWPILVDGWLARDATSRQSVVEGLRARRLGAHEADANSVAAQVAYLRSCRNGPTLRALVLDHLIAAGERSAPPKPAPLPAQGDVHGRPGVPATPRSSAWDPFADALARTLAVLELDQFLILEVRRHPGYFVQFAAQGPHGLRAEAVGNNYLEDYERLDDRAVERLHALGWTDPTYDPRTQPRDPDGSPNFYAEWPSPAPFDLAARMAIDTLIDVYDTDHPGFLSYNAFDEAGAAILLPGLGLSRVADTPAPSAPPEPEPETATPDIIRAKVRTVLTQLVDGDEVHVDEDGDVPIRVGDTMLYVRVSTDAPIVEVFAPVIWGIPTTEAVLGAVNELNTTRRFVRAVAVSDGITVRAEVDGDPLDEAHLLLACHAVGTVASEAIGPLQERFGGRVMFGTALPAKEAEPPTGGYL